VSLKKKKKKDYEDKGLPGCDAVYPGTKISEDPAGCTLRQEVSRPKSKALLLHILALL